MPSNSVYIYGFEVTVPFPKVGSPFWRPHIKSGVGSLAFRSISGGAALNPKPIKPQAPISRTLLLKHFNQDPHPCIRGLEFGV